MNRVGRIIAVTRPSGRFERRGLKALPRVDTTRCRKALDNSRVLDCIVNM